MSKFEDIRSFHDSEVNEALSSISRHPMMLALMNFTFPETDPKVWREQFEQSNSIYDFQKNCISYTIRQILEKSSDGLSTSGFDLLDKETPYLFISNHRDIVLDTSLLNFVLLENGYIMTSSAIGDNLVQTNFLHVLARLNRNFLVQRGLSIREQLQSSKLMSEYIDELLHTDKRSVWMAQREGRTKDGNDVTQQGILKMLTMASGDIPLLNFLKKMKIVPLSISYEYDPTDVLKMPQMMAKQNDEVYIKGKDEDFSNVMSGVLGQKKRIHLHAGNVLDTELDDIFLQFDNKNKQLQAVAELIDDSILQSYQLWPTNFIAYDLMLETDRFSDHYTAQEQQLFERRLEKRIDSGNISVKKTFLAMYANPVINKMKYKTLDL